MFRNNLVRFATIAASLFVALIATTNVDCQAKGKGSFAAHHPRRAEVNHRDRNINNRINRNKGGLDGHYGQLKHEDRAIHRQQRADARANGGHITRAEKHQLNREENGLNRQIRHDR